MYDTNGAWDTIINWFIRCGYHIADLFTRKRNPQIVHQLEKKTGELSSPDTIFNSRAHIGIANINVSKYDNILRRYLYRKLAIQVTSKNLYLILYKKHQIVHYIKIPYADIQKYHIRSYIKAEERDTRSSFIAPNWLPDSDVGTTSSYTIADTDDYTTTNYPNMDNVISYTKYYDIHILLPDSTITMTKVPAYNRVIKAIKVLQKYIDANKETGASISTPDGYEKRAPSLDSLLEKVTEYGSNTKARLAHLSRVQKAKKHHSK